MGPSWCPPEGAIRVELRSVLLGACACSRAAAHVDARLLHCFTCLPPRNTFREPHDSRPTFLGAGREHADALTPRSTPTPEPTYGPTTSLPSCAPNSVSAARMSAAPLLNPPPVPPPQVLASDIDGDSNEPTDMDSTSSGYQSECVARALLARGDGGELIAEPDAAPLFCDTSADAAIGAVAGAR